MEKYKGKYRIESHRRKGWDYAATGSYFLTLCTYRRLRLFGRVVNGIMLLSDHGQVVKEEWLRSVDLRKEITLGAYVVMPDHFHAIVHLTASDHPLSAISMGSKQRRPRSISSLIAGFKAAVTHRLSPNSPLWQPNYHDHIIRTPDEYDRITRYIERNPINWRG